MDISANIKAVRQTKGVAQAEIARRLDIEPPSYHRLENRGNKLSIEQVESIAGALGVGLLDLLTWGDEKPESNDHLDTRRLENDLDKSDELIKYQREKIDYLQNACARAIVEMAANEFGLNDKNTYVENHDTMELEEEYPKDWPPFLANFLTASDWAYELISSGIVSTRMVMRLGTGDSIDVPIPESIKRKKQGRNKAADRLFGDGS